MDVAELAYLAGIVDGEGSINSSQNQVLGAFNTRGMFMARRRKEY